MTILMLRIKMISSKKRKRNYKTSKNKQNLKDRFKRNQNKYKLNVKMITKKINDRTIVNIFEFNFFLFFYLLCNSYNFIDIKRSD